MQQTVFYNLYARLSWILYPVSLPQETMSSANNTHHATPPEHRIPLSSKIAYGSGQFANMILAISIGTLAYPILNIELGMNVALVGLLLMFPRIWDAFTDPVVGYLSDNTRSRWGRRKPYMFVGSIAVAIAMVLMWQMPHDWSEMQHFWYFLVMSCLFYLAYTLFVTPYMALGFELTPDYHERTRLMGVMQFIGQLGAIPMAWVFAFTERDFFENRLQGAQTVNLILAFVVVLLVMVTVFLLRDPTLSKYQKKRECGLTDGKPPVSFIAGLRMTVNNVCFLILCATTFFYFAGHIVGETTGRYLGIYYLYGSDTQQASVLSGWQGTLWPGFSLLAIPFMTWMSGRIGKRSAFMVCAASGVLGHTIKGLCYNPDMPYLILLPTPFVALGFGALWTLLASMLADVCDEDELNSGERREGTYSAAYWWIVKMGMATSFGIAGYILDISGFDETLGANQPESVIMMMRVLDVAVPAGLSLLAFIIIKFFPLTENRCYEIRSELDRRNELTSLE